jgi:hypothetical protein
LPSGANLKQKETKVAKVKIVSTGSSSVERGNLSAFQHFSICLVGHDIRSAGLQGFNGPLTVEHGNLSAFQHFSVSAFQHFSVLAFQHLS